MENCYERNEQKHKRGNKSNKQELDKELYRPLCSSYQTAR